MRRKKDRYPYPAVPVEVVSMAELLKDLGIDHVKDLKDPLIEDLTLEQGERPYPIVLETRNDDLDRNTRNTDVYNAEEEKSALEMAMMAAKEATEWIRAGSPVVE